MGVIFRRAGTRRRDGTYRPSWTHEKMLFPLIDFAYIFGENNMGRYVKYINFQGAKRQTISFVSVPKSDRLKTCLLP